MARGAKRGRDAAKTRNVCDKRRFESENGREAQLARVKKTLTDITVKMKHKNLVKTIVQALKIATDETTKEKPWDKLVELALAE